MSKEPSKLDRQRALGEANYMRRTSPSRPEEKKPPRTELQRVVDEMVAPKTPAPDLKPAAPAKNIATKRKKRAAEVIGKAREAGRLDKRQLNVWIDQDLMTRIKVETASCGMTIEEWVAETFEARLGVK